MSNEITLPKWSKDNYSSYHEWAWACFDAGKKEAVNEKQKLLDSNRELLNALTTIKNSFWTEGETESFKIADLKDIAETAINNAKSNNQ